MIHCLAFWRETIHLLNLMVFPISNVPIACAYAFSLPSCFSKSLIFAHLCAPQTRYTKTDEKWPSSHFVTFTTTFTKVSQRPGCVFIYYHWKSQSKLESGIFLFGKGNVLSTYSFSQGKNHFKNHQTYSVEHNPDFLGTKYTDRDMGHKAQHSIVTYY